MKKINNTLRKLDNKGFTLVELIIVIAIIAILIAVLAPQYTKYIDRARKSTDVQAAGEMLNAFKTAVIDPDNGVKSTDTITLTWKCKDGEDSSVTTNETDAKVKDAVQAVVGAKVTPKSTFAGKDDFTVVYKASDGTFTICSAWASSMPTSVTAPAATNTTTDPTH